MPKTSRRKERGFYKLDNTSIGMVQEDLNEDVCALADTHTKAIGRLLEDFHDDQLLLMLDTERAFNDTVPDLTEATEAQ